MAAPDPYEKMMGAGKALLGETYRQWESEDPKAAYRAALEFAESVAAGEVWEKPAVIRHQEMVLDRAYEEAIARKN